MFKKHRNYATAYITGLVLYLGLELIHMMNVWVDTVKSNSYIIRKDRMVSDRFD